ncbi:MAG: CocE/NonD family hydrolase [Candidatus Aminicenantes bacterium]|nr:CocE/NonD family hydrolase [Candidatus Aminicenantes bacterium]
MNAEKSKFHCQKRSIGIILFALCCLISLKIYSGQDSHATYVRESYAKYEYYVPMRDGVKLFTSVYVPNDRTKKYPILMFRTPYSVAPYGLDQYKEQLGPSPHFDYEGYIFVFQDVRGRMMSEGKYVNMTPHIHQKKDKTWIDESSDTYDTIEWLLKNIPNHNGKVGQWGISYPGFYTAAGMIDSHPALKAVSPQAPIADWFWDDFHHHGAFFLPHAFNFLAVFGTSPPNPTTKFPPRFNHGTPDGYQFFLELGPLKNANEKYFKGEIDFWNKIVEHPDYDDFWQARNLLPHLKNIKCAVMTVGGWYDAEDLYGPLKIYRHTEKNNPETFNILVMGPWAHGHWNFTEGQALGNIDFGFKTSEYFQKNIQLPFFNHYLKGEEVHNLPEAYVFETGANRWRTFDTWPPQVDRRNLYTLSGGKLDFTAPDAPQETFDEYISDPDNPVPYTEEITTGMTQAYMTDDQRFAARRTDVLTYQTDVLKEDLTLAGPIQAELWVSTSGSASDWVVKLVDVFPDDVSQQFPWFLPPQKQPKKDMGGYHMMVRSEVIRGRYRNSYQNPEPFEPNTATMVALELQDILHTFKRGHRIQIQIQSTWFPLVDRNPQKYVPNIFLADEEDFIKTTQRVYRFADHPTHFTVGVLKN